MKGALLEAMSQAACVTKSPSPDVLLIDFDDSSMRYQARFWVQDYDSTTRRVRKFLGLRRRRSQR